MYSKSDPNKNKTLTISMQRQIPTNSICKFILYSQSHTHFINEIEKRGSMPKQLIKPRVYVEKVYSKTDDRRQDSLLYPKL